MAEGIPQSRPGTRYGPYELIRHVATGGTASVYVARRADEFGFDKIVALKLIHPYLALQDEFVEMFLEEARIAAKIAHANVCPVFDFGRHGDSYYLAMEYIVGEPLSKIWETLRTLPEARNAKAFYAMIATIVAEAVEGLHAAHELRDYEGKAMHVVHRDVSPANIFVAYSGAVRVVDFGFAKSEAKIHQTQPGMIKGTFTYMSPEQVDGRPLDRRSDLWGAGVVLWELVTGKRLFDQKNLRETFDAIVGQTVADVASVAPDVPSELATIIRQCLERDPTKRYETARQLSQDLRRFALGTGVPVGPAEISAWLQFLFPTGLQDKRLLLDERRARPMAGRPSRTLWPREPWQWGVALAGCFTVGVAVYLLLLR